MKIIAIITGLLFVTTSSCMTPKDEMMAKSTIKLEGHNTDIRNFLEINGYYLSPKFIDYALLFFEDGSITTITFIENATDSMKFNHLSQSILYWGKHHGSHWGVYKIDKDTLVIQSFVLGNWFNNFIGNGYQGIWESKYQIIDRQTLKLIYSKSLLKIYQEYEYNKNPYAVSEKNFIYKFVPAKELPSSDCRLKEEKWIWRNEEDWKAYIKKVKQRKK